MALTKISTGGVKDDTADEAKLKVSNAGTNGQFLSKQSGNTGGLTWATVESDKIEEGNTSIETVDTGSDGHVKITTEGNERVRVIADGKVGIGTTSPNKALHVKSTGAILKLETTATTGSNYIDFNDADENKAFIGLGSGSDDSLSIWNVKSDAIRFATAGQERIRIGASGQLGIGGATYGTSGQVLTSGGGSAAPSWAAVPPGGNTVELVADGAIAAGKPVIIKSNGKAAQVAEVVTERTAQSSSPNLSNDGTHMSGAGSAKTHKFNAITFSETSNVGGFFFRNYTSGNKLECREFNLNSSGNANIPTAANIDLLPAASHQYAQISSCWEATNNKFIVVARRDGDSESYMTWASVTPSSSRLITASGNVFNLHSNVSVHPNCIDCGSGRVAATCDVESGGVFEPALTMFSWGGSNYTQGQTVLPADSGTSSNPTEHSDMAYHAAEGKIVLVYHNESNDVGCKIGTISGTGSSMTTSWGSEVTVASGAHLPQVVVDVNSGKVVVTYINTAYSTIKSKVGTISGTSISFGSEAAVDTVYDADSHSNFRPELIYLKNLKKVVYGFVTLYGGTYYTLTRTGTVSGTSISWTNQFQHWGNGTGIRGLTMVELNDATNNKIVIGGRNDGYSDRGVFKTISITEGATNVDYLNCIGFAPSAISDGATGTIHLDGNTVDNQSGLTPATRYYVQANGSLGTSQFTGAGGTYVKSGGIALSSTKLLIRATYAA